MTSHVLSAFSAVRGVAKDPARLVHIADDVVGGILKPGTAYVGSAATGFLEPLKNFALLPEAAHANMAFDAFAAPFMNGSSITALLISLPIAALSATFLKAVQRRASVYGPGHNHPVMTAVVDLAGIAAARFARAARDPMGTFRNRVLGRQVGKAVKQALIKSGKKVLFLDKLRSPR